MFAWKSLLASGLAAAIMSRRAVISLNSEEATMAKDEHPTHGPHKGAIAEWGDQDEYHVEFTVDHAKKEATVYILGKDVKTAKPIKAKEITLTLKLSPPVTLKLAAAPEQADPPDTSSRFVGKDEVSGKRARIQRNHQRRRGWEDVLRRFRGKRRRRPSQAQEAQRGLITASCRLRLSARFANQARSRKRRSHF